MNEPKIKYNINLNFEEISFPPFNDILILGRKSLHGKNGIFGCMNFLAPDNFELVEINDNLVEAILINKKILKRIPIEKVIEILRSKVFPFIDRGEIIKVDLSIKNSYEPFEIYLE